MIKDQCDKCQKRMSDDCQGVTEFDGISCENYSKGIDLTKQDPSLDNSNQNSDDSINGPTTDPQMMGSIANDSETSIEEQEEVTSEYLKENTSIHGWLVFFLFAVSLGGIISALYPLITINVAEYGGSYTLVFVDVFIGFATLFVAGYTVYSFKTRQPNAVFVAKIYVVIIFLSNLLNIIYGEFDNEDFNKFMKLIFGVWWDLFWYLYLCNSNQVNKVIPKEYRRRKPFDYYLIAVIVIVPSLLFSIGVSHLINQNKTRRISMIESVDLQYGEYTDGISVIKCPNGFTCEEKEVQSSYNQSLKIFLLESPYAKMMVFSNYDSDMSVKNFNSYWNKWKHSSLESYKEHIEIDREANINRYPYRYRIRHYEIGEQELAKRFIMLFDTNQEKVTVVSAYDGYPEYEYGPDDYLLDFISNIRFE